MLTLGIKINSKKIKYNCWKTWNKIIFIRNEFPYQHFSQFASL